MTFTGFTLVDETDEPAASDPIMQPAVAEAPLDAEEPVSTETPVTLTGFTIAGQEETAEGDEVELVTGGPDSYLEYLATLSEGVVGASEATLATLDAGAKEAVAGLSGLFRLSLDPSQPEKATELVEKVRNYFPSYVPFTEQGKQDIEAMGQLMKPVTQTLENTREWLGGSLMQTFEDSGFAAKHPDLASAVSTAAYIAPDIAVEAFGYALPKGAAKAVSKFDDAVTSFKANKLLTKAVTVDEVFGASKEIYSALDNSGIMLNGDEFINFVEQTYLGMSKQGMRKGTTPKAYNAIADALAIKEKYLNIDPATGLNSVGKEAGIPLTVLDELREVARAPAGSMSSKKEAALGVQMINAIDDFVEGSTADMLIGGVDDTVAGAFQQARDLWGRGRRTELLQTAFQKAERNVNTPFVKAVNTEYNKILQNEKLYKMFTPEEQKAIHAAAKGDKKTNVIKAVASLGFYDGDGAGLSILRPMAAAGTASYLGGPLVGFAVPIIGQVSKPLARHLVAYDAKLAEAIIMAGKNGQEIAKQYIKYVPKAERSAQGLAELLLTRGASVADMLGKTAFIDDAIAIVQKGSTAYSTSAVLESLATIGKQTEETKE